MVQEHVTIYAPGDNFPPISVTASNCTLDCAHCGGRYLHHMLPATTPEALHALCENMWNEGKQGVLISGGCDIGGVVPLDPFVDAIKQIKKETGLVVNVHTGLLDNNLAEALAGAEVDVVSFDLVGSEKTIHTVYGIKRVPGDYENALDTLLDAGLETVPHICIGLDHGQIVGERNALAMVTERNMDSLVFLVLVPTRGTRMALDVPPSVTEVAGIIREARSALPKAHLLLGCMRPKGEELELAALDAGIDGIVLPRKSTIQWLEKEGVAIDNMSGCCAIPKTTWEKKR